MNQGHEMHVRLWKTLLIQYSFVPYWSSSYTVACMCSGARKHEKVGSSVYAGLYARSRVGCARSSMWFGWVVGQRFGCMLWRRRVAGHSFSLTHHGSADFFVLLLPTTYRCKGGGGVACVRAFIDNWFINVVLSFSFFCSSSFFRLFCSIFFLVRFLRRLVRQQFFGGKKFSFRLRFSSFVALADNFFFARWEQDYKRLCRSNRVCTWFSEDN